MLCWAMLGQPCIIYDVIIVIFYVKHPLAVEIHILKMKTAKTLQQLCILTETNNTLQNTLKH